MKISSQRHHAQTAGDDAYSCKIDYITKFEELPILKEHPNCIINSLVKVILLKGCILLIDGVALERVCVQPAKQACF